jgi:hypothetical protein
VGDLSAVISAPQRAVVRALGAALPSEAYLGGGLAIAAWVGHRSSLDAYFFLPEDFDPERLAEQLAASLPALRVTGAAKGTLYAALDGVPVSVLSYRYPMLRECERHEDLGARLASVEDLVCMKLWAIASRGLARDFWDLHALLEYGTASGSLERALELYAQKHPSADVGHVVRSLVYFGEAESAPLPRGLTPSQWSRIRADFEQWVIALD